MRTETKPMHALDDSNLEDVQGGSTPTPSVDAKIDGGAPVPELSAGPHRLDPYKNFKFR